MIVNFKSVLLAMLASVAALQLSTPALAQQPAVNRDAIIQQALDQGAHIVRCVDHRCHDEQTGEYVGYAQQDGAYLQFPDDAASQMAQNRTTKALKQSFTPGY